MSAVRHGRLGILVVLLVGLFPGSAADAQPAGKVHRVGFLRRAAPQADHFGSLLIQTTEVIQ